MKNRSGENEIKQKYILIEIGDGDVKKVGFNAATKAISDVIQICMNENFIPEYIRKDSEKLIKSRIIRRIRNIFFAFYAWLKIIFKLSGDDVLLINAPEFRRIPGTQTLLAIVNRRSNVIAVAHDINALRTENLKEDRELKIMLDTSKAIIVHNDKMKKWLIENGADANRLVNLEIFDYLTNAGYAINESEGIIIAGNLAKKKSEYIYNLKESNWTYELYGLGYEDCGAANCHYHGAVEPDALTERLNGKWGLVWDGTSIDTCSGIVGQYLHYNNPHKMSLYIAAGLPIIIWNEAAQADFVRKYEIGICVSSLRDVGNILAEISEEEYKKYKENVMVLSKRVRNGEFMKKAINAAFDICISSK